MSVGILTDTTASIPAALVKELHIELVPYYIHRGLDTLHDMVDVQPEPFAAYLATTDRLPTTSNPSVGDYLNGFKRLLERTRDIVALTMTSRGSGAYQACRAAVEVLAEHAPHARIEVIDTLKVAMAHGWAAIEAGRLARAGADVAQVADRARMVAQRASMVMTADTLKYLHMGGRIGRAQHLMGSLLHIKPLIGVEEGVVTALGVARTRSSAYARMIDLIRQRCGAGAQPRAAIMHVAAPDQAAVLRDLVARHFECAELLTTQLSPALGVHSGPGTVGVSFFNDH